LNGVMRSIIAILLLPLNLASAPATTAATSAPAGAPSFPHIELSGRAIPPEQLFDEISKDTGIKFKPHERLWEERDRPKSVDVNINGPFWVAMQQACQLCSVSIDQGTWGEIVFYGGKEAVWDEYPVSTSDLGTVVAEKLVRSGHWSYRKDKPEPYMLGAYLNVFVDPRLTWMQARKPVQILEAQDDAGQVYTPMAETTGMTAHTRWRFAATVALHPPAKAAKRLVVLRGKLNFTVGTKLTPWTIENVLTAKDVRQRVAGYAVTMQGLAESRERYDLKLRAVAEEKSEDEFSAFTRVLDDLVKGMELVDEKGEKYEQTGASGAYSTEYAEKAVTFKRPKPTIGAPAKLVWQVPTEAVDVALPFEFRNLKLP
jgi:hypothetical protein